MSERYYVSNPLAPGPVELEGPEAHHLAAVCRRRPGDAVCLFNGDGREYAARVVAVERRRVRLEVVEVSAPLRELPFALEVAAPLPKGDRGWFLVEKLTELGATSFVPLETERSVVHPREAKLEKLDRHVIEASKQCGRNRLMAVQLPVAWRTYCQRARGQRALAHLAGGGSSDALRLAADQTLSVAVGPEGGFTDDEVEAARAAGWRLVDLGPRILRVETAALVLAALAAAVNAGLPHPDAFTEDNISRKALPISGGE